MTLLVADAELDDARRYRELYMHDGVFGSSLHGATVEGARSARSGAEIRKGIARTWRDYTERMRDQDLDVGESKGLYGRVAWNQLRAMNLDELDERRTAMTLGMGLVGKDHLPHPPWEFRITKIEVDPWERQAKVTAEWSAREAWRLAGTTNGQAHWKRDGEAWRLTIPMEREYDDWKFTLGEVLKEQTGP